MTIRSYEDALLALLKLEPVEVRVIDETRAVLAAPEFRLLRQAFQTARCLDVRIGEWVIQFETEVPDRYFGMTLFGVSGFVLGKLAFQSEAELQKTILWELYRLCTGQSASGKHGEVVESHTRDAEAFVNRAWPIMQWLVPG